MTQYIAIDSAGYLFTNSLYRVGWKLSGEVGMDFVISVSGSKVNIALNSSKDRILRYTGTYIFTLYCIKKNGVPQIHVIR